MAILFADGLDQYTTRAGMELKYDGGPLNSGGVTLSTTSGRFGQGGVLLTDGGLLVKNIVNGSPTTCILQLATKVSNLSSINIWCFQFRCSQGTHVGIYVALDGSVKAYRGTNSTSGTLLGSTVAGIVNAASYTWLSMKVVINNTTGSVVIKDSVGTSLLNLTNINTRNFTTTIEDSISQIYLFNYSSGAGTYIDDIVILDTTGSAPFNDHTVDMRIHTLVPNAVGNTSGLTRTGGTASGNYTAVNDSDPNGDTSYVSSNVAGTKDTYGMTDLLSTPSSIYAVVASPIWKKTDAGARTAAITVRSGGTDADSSAVTPPTAYTVQQIVMLNNPVTAAAWTLAEVNAVEAGPKVVT